MFKVIFDFFYKYPSETFDRFIAFYSILSTSLFLILSNMEFLEKISADAIFTCLTTLFISTLVFYLGQYFDRRKLKKQIEEKRAQIRELLFINSDNLSKELEEQREIFADIAQLLNIDSSEPYPLKNYRVFSHKQIGHLKYEDVFDAFGSMISERQGKELFSGFWRDIAEISGFMDPHADFVPKFIDQSNSYQREFEEVLSEISTRIGAIMLPVSGRPIYIDEYQRTNPDKNPAIFAAFHQQIDNITRELRGKNNTASILKNSYIVPLLALFNTPDYYPYYEDSTIPNLLRRAESIYQNYSNFYENGKANTNVLAGICSRLSEKFGNFDKSFIENQNSKAA